ncbi:MAG: aspartate/glutamate racemase family protein [Flavobacteriaceae bacterium]
MAEQVTPSPRRPGGKRVGLVVPSVNAVVEPDFAWAAPPGVTFHATRVPLSATTPEGLREMNRSVAAAAGLLAHLTPDLIAYACTSGSFVDGEAGLRAQTAQIADIAGCPVVTTSGAIIDAFGFLGIGRVALATPYRDEVNEAERAFFAGHGIDVLSVVGLGLSGQAIREVTPERVVELAHEADTPDSEALFLSCTDLRALEVVDRLEQELGKPVLSSNQVTLWGILRALGEPTRFSGLGRLLAQ